MVNGKQVYRHREKCPFYKEEGVDHVVCQLCGYKTPQLGQHVKIHGFDGDTYRKQFPAARMTIPKTVQKRADNVKTLGGYKPISEKRGAQQCDICSEWYQPETAKAHRKKCIAAYPDAYKLGYDYVKCPECNEPMLRLGRHLKDKHGWDDDKIALAKGEGLELSAQIMTERRLAKQDMEATKRKREATNIERYGHANPFSNPEVQEKIKETSQRRYGADHPMRNEDVRIRQYEAAQQAPSQLEVVFDGLTPDNVVFTGYGGRFVRCKKGVEKYGRVLKDLNPDFMVFPDNVLQSALSRSAEHKKLDNNKHRTRYVVELLGDYYHSEGVIGVDAERHEREIVEAYASSGIDCLVLWEHQVLSEWDIMGGDVMAWVSRAIDDMNANPVWRKK